MFLNDMNHPIDAPSPGISPPSSSRGARSSHSATALQQAVLCRPLHHSAITLALKHEFLPNDPNANGISSQLTTALIVLEGKMEMVTVPFFTTDFAD
jgi:hypothetical protein